MREEILERLSGMCDKADMRPHRAHHLFYSAAAISVLAWCAGFAGLQKSNAPVVSVHALSEAARMKQLAVPAPLRKLVERALALPKAERSKALDKAMARFARLVSAEDAEWFLELRKRGGEPGISDEQWNQFLTRWAGAQPEKVADFLEGHGLLAGAGTAPPLNAWAHGDAPSILAWVAAGGDKRKEWWAKNYYAYGTEWAAHDLDGALAWLEKENGAFLGDSIIAALHQQRGIPGIAAWLAVHGEKASSGARVAAAATILQHTLKTGGPEAAAAYLESRPHPDELANGVHILSATFAATAPEKALTWLDRLASRPGFPRSAAEAAMSQWVATDSGAAGDWLNAHRTSPAFTEYVWAYAMNLAVEDPDAARQWAALLPPEVSPPVQTVNGFTWQAGGGFPGEIPSQSLGTLAQHIDAAAGLLSARNRPPPAAATEAPPVVAQNVFKMRYSAVLVREFPGAEPTVRMVPRSPFG